MIAARVGATEELRQALLPVEVAEAVGQIDPVPRLLDHIRGQPPLQLALENSAGIVGAELGQGPDLNDIMRARSQAGLDGVQLPAFQQFPEAVLGGFHRRLTELAALEEVDVLPAHGRQLLTALLLPAQVPPEEEGRRHQDRQQNRHD